jgi:Mg2+ and Co2+ transporter CorA
MVPAEQAGGIARKVRRAGLFFSLCLLAAGTFAPGQKSQQDPLTPAQVEEIREAGIDPNTRILLYAKYVNQHMDAIKDLVKEGLSRSRSVKMDNELQRITALSDELSSNLDQYGSRKADIRKALKKVTDDLPKWTQAIQGLPANSTFDLSRKDALESLQDMRDDATQMLTEQRAYFKEHKDQRGQERAEPD